MFDIEKEYDQWLENGDPATKKRLWTAMMHCITHLIAMSMSL